VARGGRTTREIYGDNAVTQVAAGVCARAPMSTRRSRCASDSRRSSAGLDFEDLAVHFECCAASSIERAAEHWFTSWSLWRRRSWRRRQSPGSSRRRRSTESTSSTAASSTRCRWDGPSSSARQDIYVLQVGRVERPLTAPNNPIDVAQGVLRDRTTAPFPPRDGPHCPRGCAPGCCPAGRILESRRLVHRLPQFRRGRAAHRCLVCRERRLPRRPTSRHASMTMAEWPDQAALRIWLWWRVFASRRGAPIRSSALTIWACGPFCPSG
jgi:hypothetical protein